MTDIVTNKKSSSSLKKTYKKQNFTENLSTNYETGGYSFQDDVSKVSQMKQTLYISQRPIFLINTITKNPVLLINSYQMPYIDSQDPFLTQKNEIPNRESVRLSHKTVDTNNRVQIPFNTSKGEKSPLLTPTHRITSSPIDSFSKKMPPPRKSQNILFESKNVKKYKKQEILFFLKGGKYKF